MISGTLKSGNNTAQITNGKLHGDQISLLPPPASNTPVTQNGNTMEEPPMVGKWSATGAGSLGAAKKPNIR
jgi:hypothetical protein